MYEDIAKFSKSWAIPLLAAGIFLVLAETMSFASTTPTMMLFAFGLVFGSWAVVNFGYQLASAVVAIRNEAREIDFKLSGNYKAEIISHMNDNQIKCLRAGHHVLDIVATDNGPVEKIYGEDVYLYTAWWVLTHSTNDSVYPINRFNPGTYHFDMLGDHAIDDYQQVRMFHVWLCAYEYASWGRGNQSAYFTKGMNPDEVLRRLGMDRDTYRQAEEE